MSGAFTGGSKQQTGAVRAGQNGTLFLDEIGDLKPELQVKLLRPGRKGFYEGGRYPEDRPEARVVAATNVDLKEAMQQGRFRDDLYYRLFTVPIDLPPLREKRRTFLS
jgi:transcriptional regulator with PAS, ATPase and Fis domain